MNTDTTLKKMPTGSANSAAGDTDSAIVPNLTGNIKAALMRLASLVAAQRFPTQIGGRS